MLLAGPGTELKGKLTEKMRYRPTAMIKPLMPAGASSLERLPSLMEGGLSDYELLRSEPTEQQLEEYSGAVRKTAKVFSSMQVKEGTVAERDKYVVWVDAWCKLNGFGGYVVMDETGSCRFNVPLHLVRSPLNGRSLGGSAMPPPPNSVVRGGGDGAPSVSAVGRHFGEASGLGVGSK